MAIIYRPNVPGFGGIARNLATSVVHVKNSRGLDKVPSTAAKKRFAAKLRKIRWKIYRDIDLKRGNIVKTLKYYKRQVRLFLRDFSKKLKPTEPSIWKEKVSKTSDDVHAYKRNKKKAQICAICSAKFDGSVGASLPSLSAANHFVRANKTALIKDEKVNNENLDENAMPVEVEAEHFDVKIDKNDSGDEVVAIAQKESRLAEFLEIGATNPVPADQVEELLLAISREASYRVSKKSYVVMKAEEATADDDENDKSAAAAMASKEETDDDESSVMREIAIRSSKPTVFNPVDWSKCLKVI